MKRTNWTPTLAWLAAAAAAFAFAAAGPNEVSLMGRLPSFTAKRLDQQHITLPQGIPADRSLALIAFNRTHRAEIESWIDGLQLRHDPSIAWFKMPVLKDPGNQSARDDIESVLLARYTSEADRARLIPLFTDRDAFIRAAGISSTARASVLVVDRDGRVLARAEGQFDQRKGQALRETLLASRSD